MTRIFLPHEALKPDQISITGDNARHLSLVLKIQPGEQIEIFDGRGQKYDCTIMSVHKKEVIASIKSQAPYSAESPVSITLAQGIAKGEKMDFIIQKSTEVGVSRIIPLVTERSQVRKTHKVERWKKIALSAAEQSGRSRVPEVEEPVKLQNFLSEWETMLKQNESLNSEIVIPAKAGIQKKDWIPGQSRNDKIESSRSDESNIIQKHIGIIFSEGCEEKNLRKTLSSIKGTRKCTIMIGPEGGFSQEEISSAVERGFIEVSLGPRILRTETAPLSALSIIQYELGDIG